MSAHSIMYAGRTLLSLVVALLMAGALAGCGHDGHDHGHAHDHGGHDDHGHEHEGGSEADASFEPGRGVVLSQETRESIGLKISDVTQRNLPRRIPLTFQVFGEKHRHALDPDDHAGCDVHGSGFLAAEKSGSVRVGMPVEVLSKTGSALGGVVLSCQEAAALGEAEVLVGLSNAMNALSPGEFVQAQLIVDREIPVTVVPKPALLRTAGGDFVYVVENGYYRRTAVTAGASSEEWIEITDGLQNDARIVIQPVQTLYLIELRATKGGGHSH